MCVYIQYVVLGVISWGQLCDLSHLPPHSTDTQGNSRRGGDSFEKKKKKEKVESGSSGLMGNNAGFTDGAKAQDTGWVRTHQSTNLFDRTVGHSCHALSPSD